MSFQNKKIKLDDVISAVESDDSIGFCLACGEEASGVEPDAEGHECESCGKHRVYGAEQILLIGATR